MKRIYRVRSGEAVLISTRFADVVKFLKKILFSHDYQDGLFRLEFEVKKFSSKDSNNSEKFQLMKRTSEFPLSA